MIGRKAIVAGVKKVGQDPPKIKVDKTRPVAEQKRPAGQHLLERNEQVGQVGEQRLLAGAPLLEAAAAELAFLVPEMAELLGGRDEFPVIHVVQFKAQPSHCGPKRPRLSLASRYLAMTCELSSVSNRTLRPSFRMGTW